MGYSSPLSKNVQPHLSPSLGVKDYISLCSKLSQSLTGRLFDLYADHRLIVIIYFSDMSYAFKSDVRYAALETISALSHAIPCTHPRYSRTSK